MAGCLSRGLGFRGPLYGEREDIAFAGVENPREENTIRRRYRMVSSVVVDDMLAIFVPVPSSLACYLCVRNSAATSPLQKVSRRIWVHDEV